MSKFEKNIMISQGEKLSVVMFLDVWVDLLGFVGAGGIRLGWWFMFFLVLFLFSVFSVIR